ncbi:hypothetical protein SCHPADRAFT_891021 [Schizopora paradoxa]|uniref:Chromatin elongation factor SPT5 n=1 Tax=Schizopora paradoxa TaxID=27342 RepID=A0A0H2RKH1_9AGAM|nr:hypothetical protein SCHPADRAFT_891021 [Schizopora paradoxa]
MRRRKDPSRFLDLFAGDDDEEEEEEEEDEEEESEDGDGSEEDGGDRGEEGLGDDEVDDGEDGEDLDGADLEDTHFNSGSFRYDGDDDELDAALDALRMRAVERASRSGSSTNHYAAVASPCPLSNMSSSPTYADSAIFSIQVKKGKEQLVVFRLIRKWTAALDINPIDGIRAIFHVPHMVGRIYIEALAPTCVERLCLGMIRNGLYAGDIGELVKMAEDRKNIIVKLKSREQIPTGKKRKRGGVQRRDPCVFDLDLLRRYFRENEDGNGTIHSRFKDLGTEGFLLDGRRYTSDGFLLLEIRLDRVDRDVRNEETFRTIVAQESRRAVDMHLHSDPTEALFAEPVRLPGKSVSNALPDRALQPGHDVQICSGPSAGALGYLFSVTSTTCVVDIGPEEPEPRQSVFLECDLASVKRIFHIGERVEVIHGELKGRSGIVFSVDGDILLVVDTLRSAEVPRDFVTTVLKTKFSNQRDEAKAQETADAVSLLRFGWFVKILRGKHAGKTGRVVFTETNHVCIIEDVTKIQLRARADNVEVYGAVPKPKAFVEPTEEDRARWNERPVRRKIVPEEPGKCYVNHFALGFEGQEVYVWRGPFKGKIGKVLQVSGPTARLSFDSAFQGRGLVDIPTGCLVAECACTLAPDVDLPWTTEEKLKIPSFFKRPCRRGNTPPSSLRGYEMYRNPEPSTAFHDPSGEGMWIFHEGVSRHRTKYNLVVKIESHREAAISGLREGRVLADPSPLVNPIRLTTPTTVLVRVPDRRHRTRVESLHVASLRMTSKVKEKGLHVIVKGDKAGMLVVHLKSDGRMARVFEAGKHRSTAFYIEKQSLYLSRNSCNVSSFGLRLSRMANAAYGDDLAAYRTVARQQGHPKIPPSMTTLDADVDLTIPSTLRNKDTLRDVPVGCLPILASANSIDLTVAKEVMKERVEDLAVQAGIQLGMRDGSCGEKHMHTTGVMPNKAGRIWIYCMAGICPKQCIFAVDPELLKGFRRDATTITPPKAPRRRTSRSPTEKTRKKKQDAVAQAAKVSTTRRKYSSKDKGKKKEAASSFTEPRMMALYAGDTETELSGNAKSRDSSLPPSSDVHFPDSLVTDKKKSDWSGGVPFKVKLEFPPDDDDEEDDDVEEKTNVANDASVDVGSMSIREKLPAFKPFVASTPASKKKQAGTSATVKVESATRKANAKAAEGGDEKKKSTTPGVKVAVAHIPRDPKAASAAKVKEEQSASARGKKVDAGKPSKPASATKIKDEATLGSAEDAQVTGVQYKLALSRKATLASAVPKGCDDGNGMLFGTYKDGIFTPRKTKRVLTLSGRKRYHMSLTGSSDDESNSSVEKKLKKSGGREFEQGSSMGGRRGGSSATRQGDRSATCRGGSSTVKRGGRVQGTIPDDAKIIEISSDDEYCHHHCLKTTPLDRMQSNRNRKSSGGKKKTQQDDDLDRRGRPGRFSDAQTRWLAGRKGAYNKKISPCNGAEDDDPDVKQWVDGSWKDFKAAFPDDLDGPDDKRGGTEKMFREHYRNRKNYLKRKLRTVGAPSALPTILTGRAPTGYHLFTQAHTEEVTKLAKGGDDDAEVPVGTYQTIMGQKWQSLTKEERKTWNDTAKTEASVRAQGDVYKNQESLLKVIGDLLRGSQGFETKQSGDSAHLLISTFRDKDGVLQNHVITIEGTQVGKVTLSEVVHELKAGFIKNWDAYCDGAIPDTIADLQMSKNANEAPAGSPPLLPDTKDDDEEDNITPAVIRTLLYEYYKQLWAFSQGDSNKDMPWDDITKSPETFIVSSYLPAAIPFQDPRIINRNHLFPLRIAILNHQVDLPLEPFVLFADKSPECNIQPEDMVNEDAGASDALVGKPIEDAVVPRHTPDVVLAPPSTYGHEDNRGTEQSATSRGTSRSPSELDNGSEHGLIENDSESENGDRRIVDPIHAQSMTPFMPLKVPEHAPADSPPVLASNRPEDAAEVSRAAQGKCASESGDTSESHQPHSDSNDASRSGECARDVSTENAGVKSCAKDVDPDGSVPQDRRGADGSVEGLERRSPELDREAHEQDTSVDGNVEVEDSTQVRAGSKKRVRNASSNNARKNKRTREESPATSTSKGADTDANTPPPKARRKGRPPKANKGSSDAPSEAPPSFDNMANVANVSQGKRIRKKTEKALYLGH